MGEGPEPAAGIEERPPPTYEEATSTASTNNNLPRLLADTKRAIHDGDSDNEDDLYDVSRQLSAAGLSSSGSGAAPSYSSRSGSFDQRFSADASRPADQIMSQAYADLDELAAAAAPWSSKLPRLAKPIAIPQLTQKQMPPYARAYPPVLASYGISPDTFLNFVDTLNVLTTENPALRALSTAGNLTSNVPNHIAQIAGMATQLTTKASAYFLSATMGAQYVKRANDEIFHPRQLHVQVASATKLRELTRIPESSVLAAPISADSLTDTILERRMAALAPWLSELQMHDLPPRAARPLGLARMCEYQVRKESEAAERAAIKRRAKQLGKKADPAGLQQLSQSLRDTGDAKLAKHADKMDRKAERREGKDEKKRQRVIERTERKIQRQLEKGHAVELGEIESRRDRKLERIDNRAERKSERREEKNERREAKGKGKGKDHEAKAAEKAKWLVVTTWDGSEESVGFLQRMMSPASSSSGASSPVSPVKESEKH